MIKIFAIVLLLCTGFTYAQEKNSWLYMKGGRVEATGVFRHKSSKSADVYFINLRKNQEVSIKVRSNSVFLTKGNECGMYFRLFDDKGIETKIGDAPAGVDDWSGYLDHAGKYKITIQMKCFEVFTAKQLAVKKPKFTYTLSIFQPLAPSR